MNQRSVKISIILLIICLTGILVFQGLWVKNAFSVKEDLFDRAVNEALNNIVTKINSREIVSVFSTSFDSSSNRNFIKQPFAGKKCKRVCISVPDTTVLHSLDTKQFCKKIVISKNINNITETITQSEIIDSLITDSIKISSKIKWVNDVVGKMMIEIDMKDIALEDRIDPVSMSETIKKELSDKGLNLGYESALIKNKNAKKTAMQSKGFTNEMLNSKYKTSLFPKDVLEKKDQLLLDFPDKKTYLLESLWVGILVQVIFLIIISGTFLWTINIILRQKRNADLKNDFINNMTHELKTPISTINLATDSLYNEKVLGNREMMSDLLSAIKTENSRMNSQVEKILQMARIEKDFEKTQFSDFDAHDLITEIIDTFKILIQSKNGETIFQFQAMQSNISGDREILKTALSNIIENAIKYTNQNLKLSINTFNAHNFFAISITDNGIGINKSHQKRIFEKFYRVPTGNIHNVKGFGLGLSFTKAAIDSHKGKITISSELEKGSCFTIYLPVI